MIRSHRDLKVFQKAYPLSLAIHTSSKAWPADEQLKGVAGQLRRCSKGICANIVEGFGKQAFSKPEFRRFLGMAAGSANESILWIDYAIDLGFLAKDQGREWQTEFEEIGRMIYALASKD